MRLSDHVRNSATCPSTMELTTRIKIYKRRNPLEWVLLVYSQFTDHWIFIFTGDSMSIWTMNTIFLNNISLIRNSIKVSYLACWSNGQIGVWSHKFSKLVHISQSCLLGPVSKLDSLEREPTPTQLHVLARMRGVAPWSQPWAHMWTQDKLMKQGYGTSAL